MNFLVSIIVPVFNVKKYLKRSVLSISNQTYQNLEIILIDDGSTDNSSDLCDSLALTDSRIKVVHKQNGGLSSARNTGINIANGKFLFFIDSDDFIEKETIEILVSKFENNQNLGIVSAPSFYKYDNGNRSIYKKEWCINTERIISYNDFCIRTIKQDCCHSACCKLYKKDIFDNLRFREGKKNEDTLFMFDLSFKLKDKKLNMLEIPNKLYYYRVNNESITNNQIRPIYIDIIENICDLIKENSDNKIEDELKTSYYTQLIYFNIELLTNPQLGGNLHSDYIKEYNNKLKDICFWDVLKRTNPIITLKYILIKYLKYLFLLLYKISKRQK